MIIMKYESREPDLTCRWRSDGYFPSVCPERGWTTLKNLKKQVDPTAALNNFVRWGEPRWTQSRSGQSEDTGHGLTPGQFLLFSLSSWPLSLAVCREQATLAKPLTCISAPRAQKELKPLSHFFAICCKFKAARDKAFFMGESEKRKDYL